MIINNYSFN